jgi:hypothetical protein
MPGLPLVWAHWYRSDWMRDSMKRHSYSGVTWKVIFHSAMGKVFFDADGKPGVLYSGQLGREARAEIENNEEKVWGFTNSSLIDYLDRGEFKYGTTQVLRSLRKNRLRGRGFSSRKPITRSSG